MAASEPRRPRVVVPLGTRVVTGIVVRARLRNSTGSPQHSEIRSLIEVLDADTALPEAVVNLALWVAEYYACGVGDALVGGNTARAGSPNGALCDADGART